MLTTELLSKKLDELAEEAVKVDVQLQVLESQHGDLIVRLNEIRGAQQVLQELINV